MKRLILAFVLVLAIRPSVNGEALESKLRSLLPVPVNNVSIDDSFWGPKVRVVRERTIPHSWQYMQWELRSLRLAAGETVDGELNGTWGEANLYKFLETVAYALAIERNADLEAQVDEIIGLLAKAQQPGGYLHAYVTNSRRIPWDPGFLDGSHDGYVLGHMIEASLAYAAATGNRAFLDLAQRAADQAWRHFLGPNGQPGFCGHAELEMALVELYRVTREPRYLALARAFVEWRGRGIVQPAGPTPRAYYQDAVPLRAQRTLEGHAVRAVFFATGVVDLALETGEVDYRLAANRFWDSTTLRRMTITGSVGPRREHEAFGEDYELPQNGYYESCAACGLVDFAHRMFLLERRSESVDVLERVLYNAVLHGISLDGTKTYYRNPLSDRDHPRQNSWVCCPPNLSRTLLQVGRYAYAYSSRELYVNLFVGGEVLVPFAEGERRVRVETEYPWDGRISVHILDALPAPIVLHVRRPWWCRWAELRVNGVVTETRADESGYWTLDREWEAGDTLSVRMDMPVERMEAHPNIESCRGKVALQRGPLIYGFEGLDNSGNSQVRLGKEPSWVIERGLDRLGDVVVVRGRATDGGGIQAIPFYALANRERSNQEVWVEQEGMGSTDPWWWGALYRPLPEDLPKDQRNTRMAK